MKVLRKDEVAEESEEEQVGVVEGVVVAEVEVVLQPMHKHLEVET